MKFFKKPAVAVILTLLIIALSCVWGYTRVYLSTQMPETNIGSDRVSGESNLNYYLRWTSDSAELFSADTIDTIARTNLVLDGSYGSLMALKTVHHLNGMDIQTYAKNTADQIELGDRDLLLLLDASGENWYVVYGGELQPYVEGNSSLPNLFRQHLSATFWSEEIDRDQEMLSLLDDLKDWYAQTLPVQENHSDGMFFQSDGTIQTISLGGILSGILLTLLANLWWIILLFIVLNIVDRVRFDRFLARHPSGSDAHAYFHPFLFWHRPGSRWYEQMMERDLEDDEDEPEDGPQDPGPGPDSGPSGPTQGSDGYQRGPGYSTDPNEPGPFGPGPGQGPQSYQTTGSSSDSLMNQLYRLCQNLLDLFLSLVSAFQQFLRRM